MFRSEDIDSFPGFFDQIEMARDVCVFLCCAAEKGADIVNNCLMSARFVYCF